MPRNAFSLAAAFFLALLSPARAQPPTDAAANITAVSFNIRFASANDGPDAWPLRSDKVIQVIKDLDPHVLGLQEAEAVQVRQLLAALPRFAALGVHRDDGRIAGEGAPILYDRLRFAVAESGVFWLSDTPTVIASRTWDNVITRICTWARLIDLETGVGVYVYNAHFDHVGQSSRENAARLIRRHITDVTSRSGRDDPAIVLGDFNANEQNPAFLALLDSTLPPPVLSDTYRVIHRDGPVHTFTGFRLDQPPTTGKIDHVLSTPGLRVIDAGIDTRTIDGRYPSDHFPVWATLRFDATP